MDLDAWPYPRQPVVPVAETVHERYQRRDLPRLHPRLPVLPGRDDHPAGPRAVDHHDRLDGRPRRWPPAASTRWGCCRCPVRTTARSTRSPWTWPTATRAQRRAVASLDARGRVQCDLGRGAEPQRPPVGPDVRSRGRHRSGMRKVINKMVTEEDLIRTVTTAYAGGWRQVKLYFMCGLPTETDEDVLAIAQLAGGSSRRAGRRAGARDIRCTVSIGGFVPKPHTPFQWAAQCEPRWWTRGCGRSRGALRADRAYGKSIGFRYHDGRAGPHRGPAVARRPPGGPGDPGVWRDGARFDGWSEYFSFERWVTAAEEALASEPVDLLGTLRVNVVTVRCSPGITWTRALTATGSGRTGRTPSPPRERPRWKIAGGLRVTNVGSVLPWVPRSR